MLVISFLPTPLHAQGKPKARARLPAIPADAVQTLSRWSYPRYDAQDRLEMEARGDEAKLIGLDVLELKNPLFALYRYSGPESRPMRTSVKADSGVYDRPKGTVRFRGHVVLEGDDGTRIETETFLLELETGLKGDAASPGAHGSRSRRLSAPGAVRLTRPGVDPTRSALAVSGEELEGEDDGRNSWLRIARDIHARITEEFEQRYLRPHPPAPGGRAPVPPETTITCRGPFRLDRLPAEDRPTLGTERFRYENDVTFLRVDTQGRTSFRADRLDLHVVSEGRSLAPARSVEGGRPVDAIRLQAEGAIAFRHEDPPPETGEEVSAEERTSTVVGERLVWAYQDDTVILWGAPTATCRRGTTGMSSETITVGRLSSTIDCEGRVEAVFHPIAGAAAEGEKKPDLLWEIECGRLEFGYVPSSRLPSTLHALDDVRVRSSSSLAAVGPGFPLRPPVYGGQAPPAATPEGVPAKSPPARRICAEDLFWDQNAGRARLRGSPMVSVDDEDVQLRAHRVSLQPGQDRILLRGPKLVVARMREAGPAAPPAKAAAPGAPAAPVVPEAPAETTVVRITCEGDLLWDSPARRVDLSGGAVLFHGEDRVAADRMIARLGEKQEGVESVEGFDDVLLRQAVLATQIRGDWFRWDPAAEYDLQVRGAPAATLQQETKFMLRSQWIQYNQKTGRLKALNPTQRGRALIVQDRPPPAVAPPK